MVVARVDVNSWGTDVSGFYPIMSSSGNIQPKDTDQQGTGINFNKVTATHGIKRPLDGTITPQTDEGSEPHGPRGQLIPDRCHYFLQKKRRYCRSRHAVDLKYCTEHAHTLGLIVADNPKRIPCPLDPRHTCNENKLQSHMRKCAAREDNRPVYYSQDINSGLDESAVIGDISKISVRTVEAEEIFKMVEIVKQLYTERVPPIHEEMLFHEALREEINNPQNGPPAKKHLQQNASLVGHLEKLGLLVDHQCFFEFGAGKGGLSHWVQRALPECLGSQFLLVERGSVRFKMDSYHKGEHQGPSFERLRIDIQHLDLSKVESLHSNRKPVVGLGKHLCGGATDLMLRCLVENEQKEVKTVGRCAGVVLALCCHHRCDWRSYVGKEYFKEMGFGPRDLQLLTSMTSWATCATNTFLEKKRERSELASNGEPAPIATSEGSDHSIPGDSHSKPADGETTEGGSEADGYHSKYGQLTPEAREEIGYMCKRLLDCGRQHYLQKHGFDARLVRYTTSEISLENVAIIATAKAATI